jgi:hypothetical protein
VNISFIGLLALLVISSGFFINDAFAEVTENSAYLVEGSGFAVTEELIRLSEIDIGLSSHQQSGSSIDFLIEDGFVTLDNEDFVVSALEGTFLREGRYIRINGDVESTRGFDTTISFFGRLVEESKDAAIYGFTGRITTSNDSYKIVYTAKLSQLTKVSEKTTETSIENEILTILILPNTDTQGIADSYIDSGATRDPRLGDTNPLRLSYFSLDRITIEPGTTITFFNEDDVSHSLVSGLKHRDRHDTFTPDGRITTAEILPGESINITFDEIGFYRLYDPTYPWMKIIAYVFPNSDSDIIGTQKDRLQYEN